MKTLRFLPVCLASFSPFIASLARAEFNPASVAADAQWVVSIDLDEMRNNSLGREALALLDRQIGTMSSQGAAGGPPGIDLPATIRRVLDTVNSVTAYGTNFVPDPNQVDGALIIQGTTELRRIAESLVLQGTIADPTKISEIKDLPFAAYSINGQVVIAFPPEPFILVSKSRAHLLKAREVLRGAAPSLAQASGGPLAGLVQNANRAYVVAASVAPTDKLFTGDAPQARILQLATSGMLAITDADPKTQATLRLVAATDDAAEKLLKIVQGMVAMMSLAQSNDRQLTEFLQSAEVDRKDRTISVRLSYSSAELVKMIQNVDQQVRGVTVQPARNAPPPVQGIPPRTLAEWTPDEAVAGSLPGAELLTDRKVEKVHLVNGTTLTLRSRRSPSGSAVIDYVEILPANGSASPLRFEAETMNLRGYRALSAPYASRGRIASVQGSVGEARFDFPGEDGDYDIRVRYQKEPAGKTVITLLAKDPDPLPGARNN